MDNAKCKVQNDFRQCFIFPRHCEEQVFLLAICFFCGYNEIEYK